MKQIKLSGRESAVLRAIDFSLGTPGREILERTQLVATDLLDILNGMIEVGYVEPTPYADSVKIDSLAETNFEINPSYAQQLKETLRKPH